MRPLVIKFGGTSLGTPARIRLAARRVRAHVSRGSAVAVVVSATGHTTDRILRWVDAVAGDPHGRGRREVDRALATGEELSAALFGAALAVLGVPCVSLRGGEAGVVAGGEFGAGRIVEVRPYPLRAYLRRGTVPVIAGFQGTRTDGETVTLGRGGSDISAVAIAAALGRAPCHIVTDVDAVYARDPRLDATAPALPTLTHGDLLLLAEAGAQVVHHEAARLAHGLDVPLRIYSYRAPFGKRTGTYVRTPASPAMETPAQPA